MAGKAGQKNDLSITPIAAIDLTNLDFIAIFVPLKFKIVKFCEVQ
jgi:hypothetical protein